MLQEEAHHSHVGLAARSYSRKVTLDFPLPLTIMQAVSNTDLKGATLVHKSNACWLASRYQYIHHLYFDVNTMNDTFKNDNRSNRENLLVINQGLTIIPQC